VEKDFEPLIRQTTFCQQQAPLTKRCPAPINRKRKSPKIWFSKKGTPTYDKGNKNIQKAKVFGGKTNAQNKNGTIPYFGLL